MEDANNEKDTLKLFKTFIDTLDVPTEQEKWYAVELSINADLAALFNTPSLQDTLLSAKPNISPHIVHSARTMMLAAIVNSRPELAAYIDALNDDAKELIYIEHMRHLHGDTMVNAALDDARTSYRTFYHSLQLRIMTDQMSDQMSETFDRVRKAFSQLGSALGKAISEGAMKGFSDVPGASQGNREERRSAKYGARQKKEGDQLWARRNNRKRRR